MSSYPQIRYEYADESNSSQQSASADPPLFLRPMSQQQSFEQFLHNCDDPAAPPFSPIGNFVGSDDDLFQQFNQQPSVTSFESSTVEATYWQPRLDDGSFENSQQVLDLRYSQNNNQHSQSEQFDPFYEAKHENICNNTTINSILHNQQSPQREPFNQLQNIENTPLRSLNKLKQFSLSSNNQHFKLEIKEEDLNNKSLLENKIEPKLISGPPAHWRLDEGSPEGTFSNKRQKSVKNLVNIKLEGKENNEIELVEETEQPRELPLAPNGFAKPAYSYSCLIGLALKNSTTGEVF